MLGFRADHQYTRAAAEQHDGDAVISLGILLSTLDSKRLEYGPGTIHGGFPSLGFGAGGQSYSNFLASTVL